MITSVAYKPSYLQGAYNPIIWSFFSDKIIQADFKYVIDVYQNNAFIIRLKQRPNPSGYGMVDISQITQGYLKVNDPNSPLTQGETSIDYNLGHLYASNGTMSGQFYLKVGEEYNAGGGLAIYNGVTDAVGDPAYEIWSNSAENVPIHVWPSSVDYRRQQYAMSNYTSLSGAYGLDPISDRVYDHGYAETITRLAYPLMHNSLEQNLYTFDKMVLSFINWSKYPASANNRTIYGFRYSFYNAAGTLTSTHDMPIYTGTGAGPRSLCSTAITTGQLASQYDIVHVLASPEDVVTAIGGSAAIVEGGRMEIQGFSKGVDCAFNAAITEKVTINLLEYCQPLYPRVRLSWLNQLGGRDYLNFTMLTEKSTSVKQQTYAQEEINWSSTSPVPVNVTAPPKNLATLGGNKQYNKEVMTSFKIESDWLEQDQVDLLEGLLASPQVLGYIHTGSTFDDDFPYQVNIKQSSYVSKNVRQTKLVQGTFDIEVTLTQKSQNT
ncbi:MAG: hypothetical protein ACO295_09530 [Sediminibacterium sp.]